MNMKLFIHNSATNAKKTNLETYAPRVDTIAVLESIGFKEINDQPGHMLSPTGLKASVYLSLAGYWCAMFSDDDWEDSWGAPVLWKGPTAQWDNSNPTEEVVNHLNKYHPGWR